MNDRDKIGKVDLDWSSLGYKKKGMGNYDDHITKTSNMVNDNYRQEKFAREAEETMNFVNSNPNRKCNVVSFDGDLTVKEKSISHDDLVNKVKKSISVVLIISGVVAGMVGFADIVNHPENYDTTYDKFEGAATISEIIERTPENFGIGGR